jgi:hypothetical protein
MSGQGLDLDLEQGLRLQCWFAGSRSMRVCEAVFYNVRGYKHDCELCSRIVRMCVCAHCAHASIVRMCKGTVGNGLPRE